MLILTIRTDNPEAELGLHEDENQLAQKEWHAHRELAETIHLTIRELLESQGKSLQDIQGIVVYKGPGSFTGLRIGISIANALAKSLNVPIAGETSEDWVADGVDRVLNNESDDTVLPEYGAPVHITQPRK